MWMYLDQSARDEPDCRVRGASRDLSAMLRRARVRSACAADGREGEGRPDADRRPAADPELLASAADTAVPTDDRREHPHRGRRPAPAGRRSARPSARSTVRVGPPIVASPSGTTRPMTCRLPDETMRTALGVGNPVGIRRLRRGEESWTWVAEAGSTVYLRREAGRGPRAPSSGSTSCRTWSRAVRRRRPLPVSERPVRRGPDRRPADRRTIGGRRHQQRRPNLSPRKGRVMAEAYRVLRPGGRLAIIDLLLEGHLPAEIQTHPGRLGRLPVRARCPSSRCTRRAAGRFPGRGDRADGAVRDRRVRALSPVHDELLDLIRRLVPADRLGSIATSTLIRARKPAPGEALAGRDR